MTPKRKRQLAAEARRAARAENAERRSALAMLTARNSYAAAHAARHPHPSAPLMRLGLSSPKASPWPFWVLGVLPPGGGRRLVSISSDGPRRAIGAARQLVTRGIAPEGAMALFRVELHATDDSAFISTHPQTWAIVGWHATFFRARPQFVPKIESIFRANAHAAAEALANKARRTRPDGPERLPRFLALAEIGPAILPAQWAAACATPRRPPGRPRRPEFVGPKRPVGRPRKQAINSFTAKTERIQS